MMSPESVVVAAAQVLAHVPGLVRHGSKTSREIQRDPGTAESIGAALRSFEAAVAYPPHQSYIGALHPRDLSARPWTDTRESDASRFGPRGEIMPELEMLGFLAAVDDFELVKLDPEVAAEAFDALAQHPLAKRLKLEKIDAARDPAATTPSNGALGLFIGADRPGGLVRPAHDLDEALSAAELLDTLFAKATATLALLHLIEDNDIDPLSIDYVVGCGEEAVGDRYQRGGGNMAKAIAEAAGLGEASGLDVKDFCAAPIPGLVVASALVASGVCRRVAVVAGGSVAKLGMKFQGHLRHGLPILEDVLGGAAALITADDGVSPRVRLDGVGRHKVSAGGSAPQIMEALAVEPLGRLGIPMTDVDDYATELHNPEITEPQGSGDVAARNYRIIASLAARRGDIDKQEVSDFVTTRGMPGFAPTQGHLASALCYLPHAIDRLTAGDAERIMLIAKGSLFLGRMSQLSDGMSVLLERNSGAGGV